jgi:prolyl oligopeptidase
MFSRSRTTFLLLFIVSAGTAAEPPATPKKRFEETVQGVKINDDYKWLENAADPAVQKWTEAQNQYTETVIGAYPGLPAIRKRLKALIDASSPSYFDLRFRGGTLFAMTSQPPREQPFLITLKSVDDPKSQHVILDPNKLNAKGSTAIDFYEPSLDGRLVAVCMSESGSEDGAVSVYETATGKQMSDIVPRVNFPTAGGSVAWVDGNKGFYYTRYPHEGEREKSDLNF